MVEEAERYAEADRKRKEDAETLNAAESLCYQAEKTLAEFGDKLTAELKGRIETARRETREAIALKDARLAKQKADELRKHLQEAGATIYAQTPGAGVYKETVVPPPPSEARPSGAGPRGRVVDAEYREKPDR
jgi:molecular chaperone DnaK